MRTATRRVLVVFAAAAGLWLVSWLLSGHAEAAGRDADPLGAVVAGVLGEPPSGGGGPVADPVSHAVAPATKAVAKTAPRVLEPVARAATPVPPVVAPVARAVPPVAEPISQVVRAAAPVTAPVSHVVSTAAALVEPVSQAAAPVTAIVPRVVAPATQPVSQVVAAAAPVVEPVSRVVQAAAPVVEPVSQLVGGAAPVVRSLKPVLEPVSQVVRAVQPILAPVDRVIRAAAPVLDPVGQAVEPVVRPIEPVSGTVVTPVGDPAAATPATKLLLSPPALQVKNQPPAAKPELPPTEPQTTTATPAAHAQPCTRTEARLAAKAQATKHIAAQTPGPSPAPRSPAVPADAACGTGPTIPPAFLTPDHGPRATRAFTRSHGHFVPLWRPCKPGTGPG
ncbi:hypothetical protein ACIRSS_49615 [Amycolatopsis sp. NPDC101161]|uniref:hypothetical protein n=1 Tax=Amycolatopsis sp. NPDC101161 TaxID=3363940 RepID=UPI003814870C